MNTTSLQLLLRSCNFCVVLALPFRQVNKEMLLMKNIIKIISGITCSAILVILSLTSISASASTVNQPSNTQSAQSTQSSSGWVRVVRYIPVYIDGVLVGYIEHEYWEYRMER